MTCVAGADGTPGGWAVVIRKAGRSSIRKVAALSHLLGSAANFDIIAVDVLVGLLDAYEIGGRACDRAARKLLGFPRASSVFPPPIRPVLGATSWDEACVRSRASGGRAISKQTFGILRKIEEVDELLQTQTELRGVVREVHPEVCFAKMVGKPMAQRKASTTGREERRRALRQHFPDLGMTEKTGRDLGLPTEDILDATVACWSAGRLAVGQGRRLLDVAPCDTTGLPWRSGFEAVPDKDHVRENYPEQRTAAGQAHAWLRRKFFCWPPAAERV